MTADHFIGIEKFEADLWKLADGLRANSNLASNEYFMPIMGLIFLRHATTRFYEAFDNAITSTKRQRARRSQACQVSHQDFGNAGALSQRDRAPSQAYR